MINKIFISTYQKAGWRTIKMNLENNYNIFMNHKRIRRLMKKYSLITKVRRAKPYAKMLRANHEHQTLPNLLQRKFNQDQIQKVLLTDITYLYYSNGQRAYLSAVKDVASREIIAYYLSQGLDMSIVLNTLDRLECKLNLEDNSDTIIHSDQGFHYTNADFQSRVKELGMTQSMSRKGNCLDNAPMESFFGHMKDEMEYKHAMSFGELVEIIDSYMSYYNNDRYQWGLSKMSPAQYRTHISMVT